MPMLRVQLFGEFQLTYNDARVTAANQTRLQSLLAYLLLHRRAPQSRRHLAFLFWPDSPEAQARANLRQLLHYLHHALPNTQQFLLNDNKTVQWNQFTPYTLDVAAFEELLAQADSAEKNGDQAGVCAALAAAVDLYRGDLLPACYDDWILLEREHWRERFTTTLDKLLLRLEAQRNYAQAILYAQRLLRHDPLHESTYRRLMQLYALQGERASALRTYHTCVTVLQRELEVEPHPATQEAYGRLLNLTMAPVAPTASRRVITPLVGRRVEWLKLQAVWHRMTMGAPHFVWIAGEAGIGKTRLMEEFLYWVQQHGMATARTRAYAREGSLAYSPVIEWLRSEAIQGVLSKLDRIWLGEIARLLPELLIAHPYLPSPPPLHERWQRQRFFEALTRAILQVKQPLLLLFDDLQWSDPETLEWLHFLIRFDPQARLLIVGGARPEEVDDQHRLTDLLLELRRADQLTEFELEPLSHAETSTLATQVAQQPISEEVAQTLYQATQGNPFFVAEMVRAGLNGGERDGKTRRQGDGTPNRLSVLPPKVQAVIETRLRQLSPAARTLASLAAVIGQAFTFELLACASGIEEEALLHGLDELWKRRIIREQRANAYDFSHDLMREVAYAASTPVQRTVYHRRVAQAIEQLYAADLDAVSAQLAVHYERAGLAEQAIPYFLRAATVEVRILAYPNAIVYLEMGLTLVGAQSRTGRNMKQELTLLLAKASSLMIIEGIAAPKIANVCAQVEALLPEIDDNSLHFQARQLLRQFYGVSGQLGKAQTVAEQLLDLGLRLHDPGALVAAHQGCGIVYLQLGRLQAARAHLEQAAVVYQTVFANTTPIALNYGGSPTIFGNLALTLWLLGYPDQAAARAVETVALSENRGQPFQVSVALFFAAAVYRYMGAVELTVTPAEKMLALDTQYHIPMARASGYLAQGWVWAQQGKRHEGIAQIRAGIDVMKAMNHTIYQPHRLAWLAEVQMQAGDWEAAAATLEEAFDLSNKTGQQSCDAELYRLRGEWLVQSARMNSDSSVQHAQSALEVAAEAAFDQAIDLARIQQAKSFELRAVMSLCRLWQQQGKRSAASQRLTDIYGWFSEGFDTTDLQAAKTLLAELSS